MNDFDRRRFQEDINSYQSGVIKDYRVTLEQAEKKIENQRADLAALHKRYDEILGVLKRSDQECSRLHREHNTRESRRHSRTYSELVKDHELIFNDNRKLRDEIARLRGINTELGEKLVEETTKVARLTERNTILEREGGTLTQALREHDYSSTQQRNQIASLQKMNDTQAKRLAACTSYHQPDRLTMQLRERIHELEVSLAEAQKTTAKPVHYVSSGES